jgi:hypothetical protein
MKPVLLGMAALMVILWGIGVWELFIRRGRK